MLNIIYLFHLLHTSLIAWPPTRTLHHHTGSPRGPQSMKGRSFVLLYNDSYVDMAGTKHPRIFGQQGSEALGELWEQLGPLSKVVLGCEAVGMWDSEYDSLDIFLVH